MPRRHQEKTLVRFPPQWLADRKSRESIALFYGRLPKRPRLYLDEDLMDSWTEEYNNLQAAYFRRHPSYSITISMYGDKQLPAKKNGERLKGFPLLARTSLGLNYWDTSIPENTELKVDSTQFNKLLKVVQTNGKEVSLESPSWCTYAGLCLSFVVVKINERIPRPTGTLADQPVRDSKQPTASHVNIMTQYWEEHGFLPKDQPYSTAGDCLPQAVLNALKVPWDTLYKKQKLTVEYILQVCGKTSPEMKVSDLKPFLDKYRLSLYVQDLKGNFIYQHVSKSRHKKLPCRLDILLHNKHATLLNHDLNSVWHTSQKVNDIKTKYTNVTLRTYDEVKSFIITCAQPTRIFYNPSNCEPSLQQAFCLLNKDLHLEPNIVLRKFKTASGINGHEIKELLFHHPQISVVETQLELPTMDMLRDALFIPAMDSTYSATLREAMNLTRGHLIRSFDDVPEGHKIDTVRCYTSLLLNLDYIPVFCALDDLLPYDNSLVEDYTLYVVKALSSNPEHYIYLNKEFNLVYGFTLSKCGLNAEILSMCKPSSKVPNPFKRIIKKLYSDPSNPELKEVVNILLGMSGMTEKRRILAQFTTCHEEAYHFTDQPIRFPDIDPIGYLAITSEECYQLNHGTWPLLHAIYDSQRLQALQLYRKLSLLTSVHAISADAFYVETLPDWDFHKGIKTLKSIGSLRYEGVHATPKMKAEIQLAQNPPTTNLPSYKKVDRVVSGTFIEGIIPGTGKTYAASEFMGCLKTQPALPTKSLYVIQSHERILSEKERTHNADYITYAQLLGNVIEEDKHGNKEAKKKHAGHDLSPYTHILLDELLFISMAEYVDVIKTIEKAHPLSVIATGDPDQNGTSSFNNWSDRKAFYEATLYKIFPNRLTLTESKRLESGDALSLKHRLQNESILDLAPEFGIQTTTDYKQYQKHIAYTNEVCYLLEEAYGTKPTHLKFDDYDKDRSKVEKLGTPLKDVCYYVMHEGKRHQFLVRNEMYPVTYPSEDGKQFVKIGDKLYNRSRFKGVHSKTGHSAQGDTISHPYVILEWEKSDWQWLFTAIMR